MGGFPVEEEEKLGALWNRARAGHAAEREEFVRFIRTILAGQAGSLDPDYRAMPEFSPDDLIVRFVNRLLDSARRTIASLDGGRVVMYYRAFLRDVRLDDLWRRRIDLTESEWKQLYDLVYAILHGQQRRFSSHYRTLTATGLSETDLIGDYFAYEVMGKAARTSPTRFIHAGGLAFFYKNYLISRIRESRTDATAWIDRRDLGGPDMERCAETAQVEHVLAKADLDPKLVSESATRFLRTAEPWVLIMLGHSVCPDPDDAVPLYQLAREAGIPSYADRARKLGITVGRARFGEPEAIRESLLRDWVESFGIETADGSQAVIHALLQILCQAALIMVAEARAG